MNNEAAKEFVLTKLQEPGTVAGLVLGGGVILGHAFTPAYANAISTFVVFVAPIILVWVKG